MFYPKPTYSLMGVTAVDKAHMLAPAIATSAFGADNAYNLYDKPVFAGGNASFIFVYRSPRNDATNGVSAQEGARRGKVDRPFGGSANSAGRTAAPMPRRPAPFCLAGLCLRPRRRSLVARVCVCILYVAFIELLAEDFRCEQSVEAHQPD